MYSNPHAAVGVICTATVLAITKDVNTAYFVGLPLAIISHWFLDFVKEAGFSKNEVFLFDVLPSVLFIVVAFFSGYFWLFMFSWWAGNLLDLIDKKLYLTVFYPKKFKPTFYFHKHQTGYQITKTQTIVASYIATLITILIPILI